MTGTPSGGAHPSGHPCIQWAVASLNLRIALSTGRQEGLRRERGCWGSETRVEPVAEERGGAIYFLELGWQPGATSSKG